MKNERFLSFLKTIALLMLLSFLQMEIVAQTVSSVKVYPSTLRIENGKSKTVTAAAFDSSGVYITNQNFTFTPETNVVTVEKSREGHTWQQLYLSKNLADVRTASAAGTTRVYATAVNGVRSNFVTVTVDDPNAAPVAVITGDNAGGTTITAKVGEAIELNAENSRGVKTIDWNWGDGDKTTDLLSATHAYLQAGTYTLRLTVTNSSGATAVSNVTVTVLNHIACTTTNTTVVTSVSAVRNAYDAVSDAGGRCILMEPGIYEGRLILPPRNFTEYVTIGTNDTLPDIRDRITPGAAGLVTIRSSGYGLEPLQIGNAGSGGMKGGKIRFVGIKFEPHIESLPAQTDAKYVIQIGGFDQTAAIQNPENIIFQHCVINPPDNIKVEHAILNNGYKVSIISN